MGGNEDERRDERSVKVVIMGVSYSGYYTRLLPEETKVRILVHPPYLILCCARGVVGDNRTAVNRD